MGRLCLAEVTASFGDELEQIALAANRHAHNTGEVFQQPNDSGGFAFAARPSEEQKGLLRFNGACNRRLTAGTGQHRPLQFLHFGVELLMKMVQDVLAVRVLKFLLQAVARQLDIVLKAATLTSQKN